MRPRPPPTGQRYRCNMCPSHYNRSENLTRHLASHQAPGRWACGVCNKVFARSDILKRHRRRHPPQPLNNHIAQAGTQNPQGFQSSAQHGNPQSTSQGSSSTSSGSSPDVDQNQMQPPVLYDSGLAQEIYQNMFHSVAAYHSTMLPNAELLAGNLTNLMEAALALGETVAFTPSETIDPHLWDGGFMKFGDNNSSYMGSYDGNMSWTLDYLPPGDSPNHLVDINIVSSFPGSGANLFQQQASQHPTLPTNEADVDAENGEETSALQDKVGQPAGPPPGNAARVVPVQPQPISWQDIMDEIRASQLSPASIRPYHTFDEVSRQSALSFLNATNIGTKLSRKEISDEMFPPAEVLDFFLRLYVKHVHPRYPVIHLPTFSLYSSPRLLLLVMMCLGSCHSTADRGRFSRVFHKHLRMAVLRAQENDKDWLRVPDNILTYFLLCLAGAWSGSKDSYEFAERGRGILSTACRGGRLLDGRAGVEIDRKLEQDVGYLEALWRAWKDTEKRKRLGLSIYIFDCQSATLFNNQPYISKAETVNLVFPCDAALWEAPTSRVWKIFLGPEEFPPTTYLLHAVNFCLLGKWIPEPPPIVQVGQFDKIVLMYAIHTHIFDWRIGTSLLNPTGLMATFGNSAYDMGKGLRDRRQWLAKALECFVECYQDEGTSPAALLIHHLGNVALDVNFSDLHLVAGRSVNKDDASFAAENLNHWANSKNSDTTMAHVNSMLELCQYCISTGTVAYNSYEVAICLFTGGMVSGAFAKLRIGVDRGQHLEQVKKASSALMQMGCWRMSSIFGKILSGTGLQKQE